jgi:hypothetical protein
LRSFLAPGVICKAVFLASNFRCLQKPLYKERLKRFVRLWTSYGRYVRHEMHRVKWFGLLGLFAVVLAALTPLELIIHDGVRIPFQDEWAYSQLLETIKRGSASFAVFWSQNNEHRMLIPRLEFSALALATHWDSKAIMIWGWVLMVGAALFLYTRLRSLFSKAFPVLGIVAGFACSLTFLSGVQFENWLWAFQFAFFFIQACVLVSVLLLARTELNLWFRIGISSGLAVAASVSSAQGLLLWPTLIFVVCLTSDDRRKRSVGVLILASLMIVTCLFYFHGFVRTTTTQIERSALARDPALPFFAFFGLLGNPLAFWSKISARPERAWQIGLLVTLVLLTQLLFVIRQRKFEAALPWLGLTLFSYLFCLVVTYGRVGMGYDTWFLTSRYTTHVTFVPVSIVALGLILVGPRDVEPRTDRSDHAVQPIPLFCAYALAGLCIWSSAAGTRVGFERGAVERDARLFAKSLIPFVDYFDPSVDGAPSGPFFLLFPINAIKIFEVGLKPFLRGGYASAIKNALFSDEKHLVAGNYVVSREPEGYTYLNLFDRAWILSGSLTLPPALKEKLIFFRPTGREKFVAATKLERIPDVKGETSLYRWHLMLSPTIFPDRTVPLELWIFDENSNTFLKVDR